jgi:phage/plasmid-associated DNA primase
MTEIDDKINECEVEAFGLYHRMRELRMLPENTEDDDPDKRLALRRIIKVMEMTFYARRIVLSAFQAKLAVHALHMDDGTLDLAPDLDARLGSWALRFRYIDGKTNPVQNLMLFLLDCAMEKRYRKYNGWMYEPITLGGQNIHAWKPVCEIKDFVYAMLPKETHWEQWCNATSAGTKNINAAVELLTHCKDYQLPELHKMRGVYSFRNGVYIAEEDVFHEFGGGSKLTEDVVACKFIDNDMDPSFVGAMDWRDIPTPHLQGILSFQGFSPEVCDWMYILLGRLLYAVNAKDSWQVIPFVKGLGSTGKSTILIKVAKNFYDAMDVGVLSNNIERKFGLSAFHDKYLFVAPEVKSDLCLEQAELQSVVSGEDMQINIKHQKAFSKPWAVPGILAGNEVPMWVDNGGSVQRRVIVFEFMRAVLHGDMKLGEKLDTELPALIVKCNRAYLETTTRSSHVNVWTILPKYFHGTRDALAQSVNSVEAFLASSEVVVGEELYCPMEDFRSALKAFEMRNNYKSKKYDDDFFMGPFGKAGLVIEKHAKKAYNGRNRTRDYVIGVDLNVNEDDNELG